MKFLRKCYGVKWQNSRNLFFISLFFSIYFLCIFRENLSSTSEKPISCKRQKLEAELPTFSNVITDYLWLIPFERMANYSDFYYMRFEWPIIIHFSSIKAEKRAGEVMKFLIRFKIGSRQFYKKNNPPSCIPWIFMHKTFSTFPIIKGPSTNCLKANRMLAFSHWNVETCRWNWCSP